MATKNYISKSDLYPLGKSPKVSGNNLLWLQRYLSKTISESEKHRVKSDNNKLHFSKQKYRTALLGLKSCVIKCIVYRAAAKKHSYQESYNKHIIA